jgi:hypothetical protein
MEILNSENECKENNVSNNTKPNDINVSMNNNFVLFADVPFRCVCTILFQLKKSWNSNILLPDKHREPSKKCCMSDHYNINNYSKNNYKCLLDYQNITGLRNKSSLSLSRNLPEILCFTEHHLTNAEMDSMYIAQYNLSGKFCRTSHKFGGVCIFIQENSPFSKINLNYVRTKIWEYVLLSYVYEPLTLS